MTELYPFLESKKWYLLFKGILWSRDLLGKTINTDLGLRPRSVHSRPRAQFFSIRTSLQVNNIYVRGPASAHMPLPVKARVFRWQRTNMSCGRRSKETVSPIIRSALKNVPAAILSSIESTNLLSDICNPFPSKPSIVFSPQKTFYSQPNCSSCWSGVLVLISRYLFIGSPDVNKTRKWLRRPLIL